MKTLQVTCKDWFNQKMVLQFNMELEDSVSISDPEVLALHNSLEVLQPNCNVNFRMDNDFIAGQPYNMLLDERAIDDNKMAWKDYMKKWYGWQKETREFKKKSV